MPFRQHFHHAAKGSRHLAIIVAVVLLLALFDGWYVASSGQRGIQDAALINQVGVVRGAMQRIAKRELNGERSDTLIAGVQQIIDNQQRLYRRLQASGSDAIFLPNFVQLHDEWQRLLAAVTRYRGAPDAASRQALLGESEAAWEIADSAVLATQFEAEQQVQRLQTMLFLLGANLVMVAVLVWQVRRYVRDKLEYAASHDHLTGLYNRALFEELLTKALSRAERQQAPLTLLMLDIDHFKQINDRHGHHTGDRVLRQLASLLSGALRGGDALCRVGGEEFAVIAVATPASAAGELAERIRNAVAQHAFDGVGEVTVSVGAAARRPGESSDALFGRADRALYAAKAGGRDRVSVEA